MNLIYFVCLTWAVNLWILLSAPFDKNRYLNYRIVGKGQPTRLIDWLINRLHYHGFLCKLQVHDGKIVPYSWVWVGGIFGSRRTSGWLVSYVSWHLKLLCDGVRLVSNYILLMSDYIWVESDSMWVVSDYLWVESDGI